MKSTRQMISDFYHESGYSSLRMELPANADDFKRLGYLQRLELLKKRPELYHMLAEESKNGNIS